MSKSEETNQVNCGQVIFEVLEQTKIENPIDAITYCFYDLAECNSSDMNLIKYAQKVDNSSCDPSSPASVATGTNTLD